MPLGEGSGVGAWGVGYFLPTWLSMLYACVFCRAPRDLDPAPMEKDLIRAVTTRDCFSVCPKLWRARPAEPWVLQQDFPG